MFSCYFFILHCNVKGLYDFEYPDMILFINNSKFMKSGNVIVHDWKTKTFIRNLMLWKYLIETVILGFIVFVKQ